MSYTWDLVRSQVREFRTNLQSIYPIQVLANIKDFTFDTKNNILYYLSNNRNSTDLTLTRHLHIYQINLDQLNFLHNTDQHDYYLTANLPVLKSTLAFTDYTAKEEKDGAWFHRQLRIPGVTTMDVKKEIIMFTFNNGIYVGQVGKIPKLIPYKAAAAIPPVTEQIQQRSNSPLSPVMSPIDITTLKQTTYNQGTLDQPIRADPKLSNKNDKISFIRDCDIWITDFEGNETRLTFCSDQKDDPTLRCGIAEYMMQEEFHRFTGYYWCPTAEKILYLETSEKDVEVVVISKSSPDNTTTTDSIRYPRAGKSNAKSNLKIVEFGGDSIVHKQLWGKDDIRTQFPWMEYIVRFGWLPDGKSIWLQILSRDQKKTAVLKLYSSQFTCKQIDTTESSMAEILWEETSTSWINITDVFYFMSGSSIDKVTFIWSSEKTNAYRHLYLIEKFSHQETSTVKQLTHGDWCCIDKSIYVDESRNLVYFSAKKETPLESHFYVLNLYDEQEPTLLTRPGYSHTVTMNSSDYFIDCYSTLHDPQVILVQKLNHTDNIPTLCKPALLMPVPFKVSDLDDDNISRISITTDTSILLNGYHHHIKDSIIASSTTTATPTTSTEVTPLGDIVANGEIFNFTTSDGINLYGCLYKPRFYTPDQSFPTILHIYGGPKTQLVMNEFKFPRLMRYLMSVYFGFAVVIIDSRGSSDRGLEFESHIQDHLGTVELKDQIEGLQYLHDSKFGSEGDKSVIDLKRLAITGWSYGGYLSLMALAQYPDFFKMAIAGAPVTQWELYDAAYTERYMGLPDEQPMAYHDSNVLTYVDKFPDNDNRLLIAHGLIDENVHFKNTELLVSELVKHNKPHYLQVYPSEKHGLRHASVNEHFETLMFYWLVNYL